MDNFEGGGRKEIGRDEGWQGVGRGHRPREEPPQNNTTLRRPHSSSSAGNRSNPESASSLSPQAAEFVPRFMLQQSQPYHSMHHHSKGSKIQNRINQARETPLKNTDVSSSLLMDDSAVADALQQQCNVQDSKKENYDKSDPYILYLKKEKDRQQKEEEEEAYSSENCRHLVDIIDILILNPAEFMNLVPPFINKLRWDQNMRCLQSVLTTIINKSITESNFRYNGARFCKYLDNTLEDYKELFMFSKELFREFLYFQCRVETKFQEAEWQCKDKPDQLKCNGMILFLAELVVQMDEDFAFSLGEVLIWFITKVLQRPASNTVKYICQALKLAGHVLEKDKANSKDMENMMRELTVLVNSRHVDTHVGNMVNSVQELRKVWITKESNCDLSGSSNALSNKVHQQSDQLGPSTYNSSGINSAPLKESQFDQPVMYGPDGKILSVEESQFLQDNIQLDFDNQRISEEEYDENYDDEIALAYEEFLKETK